MYVLSIYRTFFVACFYHFSCSDDQTKFKSIFDSTSSYDYMNIGDEYFYAQSSTGTYSDYPNEGTTSSSSTHSDDLCKEPEEIYAAEKSTDFVWAMYERNVARMLLEIDTEHFQDFEVDMYLALSWYDHRLKHNCQHPILITDLEYTTLIWNPDLYFVNSKFSYMHVVTTPNFMMLVYPDGLIFKSLRVDVTLSCNMSLERFPLDEQRCPIQIQSYAYVEQVVNLTWHYNIEAGFPISRNLNIKLNNMNITATTATYCTEPYPMFRGWGNWSCLRGFIHLRRYVTFHIFQTYVPTAMMVAISWLSFWLDVRASPARISLTITTLLTLTTMGNSVRQDLPQVSYVKAIDMWLSVCTSFVFCVLLEYTLVNHFIGKKTTNCKVHTRPHTCTRNGEKGKPYRSSSIFLPDCRSCSACAMKWERYAKRIDVTSRFVFPIAFLVFVVIYCFLCFSFPHVFDRNSI